MSLLTRSLVLLLAGGVLAGSTLAASATDGATRGQRSRDTSTTASGAKVAYAASFTHRGPGANFVQASWTTRTVIVGQNDPFSLVMPALPAGAVEVASFASWNLLDDSGPTPDDTIRVNGAFVTGEWKGDMTPALCSGKNFVDVFSADVTGLLNFGAANTLNDVCDKPYGTDPNALGGGITLLTVYEFANGPDREVELYRVFANTAGSGTGDVNTNLLLTTPYAYLSTRFFVNALGGSPGSSDQFLINGTGVAGKLAGTSTTGDAWIGLLGPNPDDNFYDAGEGDVSKWMTAGDTSILLETNTGTDCIAHTLAAISHQVECGDIVTYCTSKVNSLGCAPFVDTTGTPSESSGLPFRIRGFDFRNNKNGLLFYGYQPLAAPFQGGHLCVKAPIERTPVQNSGGNVGTNDCSGVYTYDFNALIRLGTDAQLVPGAFVFAQYWSRDPDDAFTTSLSNAVAFDICP
ncbi:MAG: hypothetical protein L6Q99_03420 [Planctomycetes bacterium]|nr:hypothetical protein [Planctomycetota bacterium]